MYWKEKEICLIFTLIQIITCLLSLKTKYVLGDEINYDDDDDERGSGDGVSDVFKHFENIKNSGKKKKNELSKSQEEKGKKDEHSKDDTDRSF